MNACPKDDSCLEETVRTSTLSVSEAAERTLHYVETLERQNSHHNQFHQVGDILHIRYYHANYVSQDPPPAQIFVFIIDFLDLKINTDLRGEHVMNSSVNGGSMILT